MIRDVFSLFVFMCFPCCLFNMSTLEGIFLLIMTALPLDNLLSLFWFHATRCLDPILSFADWMLQNGPLTMDNCPFRCKRVLSDAKQVNAAYVTWFIIWNVLLSKQKTFYTSKIIHLRGFVRHVSLSCFHLTILKMMTCLYQRLIILGHAPIESLSDLLFNPFELNSDDHYSPLIDIDPDMNYYNEIDSHIALNCNYYFEESISAAINDKIKTRNLSKVFSLCHVNIRSLKPNLPAFEICPPKCELQILGNWYFPNLASWLQLWSL